MALRATLTPASSLFVGNPVKLDISSSSLCRYKIYVGGSLVYTGSGIGTFYTYIQDVIASRLSAPRPFNNDDRLLIPSTSGVRSCSVEVENAAGETWSTTFKAYLGGVSRAVLRSLGNSNIFTNRFLADTGNIFFTLRGCNDYVTVKETEISPLLFIYPLTGQLSVESGGFTYNLQGEPGSMYALNIDRLRRLYLEEHDLLPSFFTIINSGTTVITIGITPAEVSRDRYYLRFLSSLGAYEIIEMKGLARRSASEDTAETPTFDVFDDLVGGYRQQRARMAVRPQLSLSTGDITEDELIFYQDMLSSEDVTLLGYHGQEFKVLPSSPELTFSHNFSGLQSFVVDLIFSDQDDRYSNDDIDARMGDGRIHTSEFTDQFN